MEMGLIGLLVLAGIAGWIATLIMGEDGRFGIVANIAIGIVGAFLGLFIGRLLGFGESYLDWDLGSFVLAIVGSCILLWIINGLAGKRRRI